MLVINQLSQTLSQNMFFVSLFKISRYEQSADTRTHKRQRCKFSQNKLRFVFALTSRSEVTQEQKLWTFNLRKVSFF